jgi:3-keto-5-aminohexanoate cleavage enzyme
MKPSVETRPVVITCSVIGGEPSSNPNHPRTFQDIVREGIEAVQAGAGILHLHAYNRDGQPVQDPAVYSELAQGIREGAGDVVMNFTTGASLGMSDEERLRSIEALPELASMNCGSMNFGKDLFLNPPELMDRAAKAMLERGIKPELECFDAGMVASINRLVLEERISSPPLVHLVLGVPGGAPATIETLCYLLTLLPQGAIWAATAVGRPHFAIMATAIAHGGNVRTGLEDVAYTAKGVFARSNGELVARAARLCTEIGRPVASVTETRSLLALTAR